MHSDNRDKMTLEQFGAWSRASYPWHRVAFIAFNVIVTAINVATGPPWWGLWPLVITGALFTLHYLVYKTSLVDDEWVEDRATDLYDRSYDQGHIDSIAGRHGLETPIDRHERAIRENTGKRTSDQPGDDPARRQEQE